MKIADLYIRVSTDEQADRGYSQRNKDEQLRKYCAINNIKIGKVIFEDHSAKSFNRPEWKALLATLRKQKGAMTDFILFTKWDRFSRNTADAYQMINILRSLGIEPQAIEQPLDLSIPENKMMLAFYLAVPEVENDRRALNTFFGMRRAKKEGRWMATAPIGYKNKVREDGRKYITPQNPNADIMKWAFEQLAAGDYAIAEILRECRKKGLKCSKNNFWVAMRNPVYCGKIFIPKYKDEEACFVDGQHEPIISETVFYDAQNVMNGRKKKNLIKIASPKELPLRGFLTCPRCGRNMSGSPSKGKTSWHFYYHCTSTCGYRQNAKKLNVEFIDNLKGFAPHPAVMQLYAPIIEHHYNIKAKESGNFKRQLLAEIEDINKKMIKVRELLISEDIEPEDYRTMKKDYDARLFDLDEELKKVTVNSSGITDLFQKLVNTLVDVDLFYSEAETEIKRGLITSIYPQKFEFENRVCRTPKINEGADIIWINAKSCGAGIKNIALYFKHSFNLCHPLPAPYLNYFCPRLFWKISNLPGLLKMKIPFIFILKRSIGIH